MRQRKYVISIWLHEREIVYSGILIIKIMKVMGNLKKIVVSIKNRVTNVNEYVFLASNKKLYTINGKEICEQNYNIDYLEMSKQYNLNFNKK